MVGFKATLINEIEKLYKKKKVLVAMVISLAFIVIGQVIMIGLRSGFGLRGVGSMEFPILVLSVVVNTIIPLFTALVTIDSFSSEFSQNTMKIAITRPVTRLKFFTAKLGAIMVFVLVNLIFVMIFSVIAGFAFNSNSFTFVGIFRIILSYGITVLPMMVLALLIVLLCNIFRSGIAVFFLSIIIFIGFKALGIYFSQYSGLFFTSMVDWYSLWIMHTMPVSKIFREFLLMVSYGILLFTGGYYLFDKKDF
ncbi:MAG: ABC transporter permease [Clostridiaceae bacterium]|nr:ABC transporter permease [Clostridiaceae bacterium]